MRDLNPVSGARRVTGRLTYANVMSTVAVFGVLAGGGAYAASKVGPRDIKKNAVRAKHVKQNQVKARHVARNAIRPKQLKAGAVRTPKIADGAVGPAKLAASALTARALGRVGNDGNLIPGTARNLTDGNLAHPETGVYCLRDLPFDPKVVVAIPQGFEPDTVGTAATYLPGPDSACPVATQFTVYLRITTTGNLTDLNFSVVLY